MARGKPRNAIETCCSMLLIFKLKIDNDRVCGFEKTYNYIKLKPIIYAEFLSNYVISKNGKESILSFI